MCTDMCYTLTPVMQTSHHSSCSIFLTVATGFDSRQFHSFDTAAETAAVIFIALGVAESKVFVYSVSVLIA